MSDYADRSKEDIRELMSKMRDSVSRRAVRRLSSRIALRLLDSPYYQNARHIMLYASFRGEVDTWQLMRRSCAEGKKVYLPRTDTSSRTMSAVPVKWDGESFTNLAEGVFGIKEPEGDAVEAEVLDLICVPALAFDLLGYRVGYGGGYYDRFLAGLSADAVSVGLGYSSQLVKRLPHEDHDIPLSRVITDSKTVNCHLNRQGQR